MSRVVDVSRVPGSEARDFSTFEKWLESIGADLSSAGLQIKPSSTAGLGAGVFVGRDVPGGGVITRIPTAAVLSTDVVSRVQPFASELKSACQVSGLGELPPASKLWVYLIYAWHRSEAPHHVYARHCPIIRSSPFLWTEGALHCLRGSSLHAKVRRQRLALWKEFTCTVCPLTAADPEHFPAEQFTFAAVLWARLTCCSRAMPSSLLGSETGSSFILCPLLDMFNHRSGAPIEVYGAEACAGSGIEFRVPKGTSPLRATEEAFNDYGENSNEDFLLNYGFCIQDNENETVEVFLQRSSEPNIERCIAELSRQKIPHIMVRKSRLTIGPFSFCKAGASARCAQLPAGLLVATAVCWHPGKALDATVIQEFLCAGLRKLAENLTDTGKIVRSGQQGPSQEQLDLSRVYMEGQKAIISEAIDAVNALSEASVLEAISQIHSNDLGMSCRSGGVVASAEAELMLTFEDDEGVDDPEAMKQIEEVVAAFQSMAAEEPLQASKTTPAPTAVDPTASGEKVVSKIEPPSCATNIIVNQTRPTSTDGVAGYPTPNNDTQSARLAPAEGPIELWVKFDGARVRVRNAQEKPVVEVLKLAYVFFSRKFGETKLPLSGLADFHLEISSSEEQHGDISNLSRTVRECGLRTGTELQLKAN